MENCESTSVNRFKQNKRQTPKKLERANSGNFIVKSCQTLSGKQSVNVARISTVLLKATKKIRQMRSALKLCNTKIIRQKKV